MPEVDSFAEFNALVDAWDAADDNRRVDTRPRTVREHLAAEAPLPDEPFETGRWFTPRVDRYAQVSVRTNRCTPHTWPSTTGTSRWPGISG